MVSIIIPTYNEERFLPNLLKCIKNQTYTDCEVIISDADSKDRTQDIAKEFGCRVVRGGLPNVGRNRGVEEARGDILIFLDADVLIDNDFLKNVIAEFTERKLDVATSYIYPRSSRLIDWLYFHIFNAWVSLNRKYNPHAAGAFIIVKKDLHTKINGFDESVILAGDCAYVKKAYHLGTYGILQHSRILVSMRRYDRDGRLSVGLKIPLIAFYRIFFGEVKKDIFKYDFGSRTYLK